jgi:putative proteasome-type protease
MSSGNLATTQLVLKKVRSDLENGAAPNLLSVNTMQEATDYVANISTNVQGLHVVRDTGSTNFEATFIMAGQIGAQSPETSLIYPQGNYICESDEHPYLQIGEIKYGKPILDRVINRDTDLNHAARCALVSMNSTIRSNLTVGPPIDLLIYEKDSLNGGRCVHLTENDAFAKQLSEAWNAGLAKALQELPRFEWEEASFQSNSIQQQNY